MTANLESIEQTALKYLGQMSKPATPVDRLHRHLARKGLCGDWTQADLIRFLREHELFHVLEPAGLEAAPGGREALEAAGLDTGPKVCLADRLPSPAELARMMDGEISQLVEALAAALEEARANAAMDRVKAIEQLMAKAETLRDRLKRV